MIPKFRILTACTLLIFTLSVKSQGLYSQKFNGPYLLLYKLNPEQVEFLAKYPNKIDSSFLFNRLVGKVHTDSVIPLFKKPVDEFPIKPFWNKIQYQKCGTRFHVWDIRENGSYLEVTVNSLYNISYRLIENPMFNSGVHRIGYETYVFVEDTAGLPVYDAIVHLDTANCPYDSSMGAYRITGKNIFGLLKIERNEIFTISRLSGYQDKTNNTQPPKDNYRYAKIRYQGYLVTNKPRYKTWDTLFFKSFLVNAKGKPIKEKLFARLYQNYSGYAKEFAIKPSEKGAYSGYFIINDSFILDQELAITLLDENRNQIKYQSVRLENYELKDLFFEFRADKQLVTPGDGIKFYASATTANRLPIMDGKLTLKMRLTNVNFTDNDSVVIPFNKYENWYQITVQTDPSGVTIFDIPDSIFYALDGEFYVTCSLLTSDNETREASVSFLYQTTRDRQEANMDGDTLRVKRLYNMKSVRKEMHIKIWSKKDLLIDSVFHTPLNIYLKPNVYMAQIYRGDTLAGTFYRQTQLPDVWGKRTHDSIHIYFKSTFDIPVFYRIYANNMLVAKGKSNSLTWHAKDKKKSSYHIQYGILEGSVISPRFYSKSFHLAEKELTVDIIQPSTVYPGQEVPIEIVVKDAYGKPVNKVNLTAWAVNTQMEEIVTPELPYMGLVKTQKPLPTKYWPVYFINQYYAGVLKDWQVDAFFLRKNKIFHLAYPPKGFDVLYDTTPHQTTEIDFFAHGLYSKQDIAYIKANDTLLWCTKSSPRPSVMKIKPGKHDFTIRTFNHIYQFKNVEIKEGKKNFICLQLDTLNKLNKGDTISEGKLTSSELEMIYEHAVLFRFDKLLYDTFIIKVNGKVRQGFAYGSALASNNYLQSVRLKTRTFNPTREAYQYNTWQDFMVLGQLNEDDEVEFIWKNNYSHYFKFKKGMGLSFTKNDIVVDYYNNWKLNILFLQRNSSTDYQLNSFWWDPYQKDTIKKQPITPTPYEPTHYVTDLPEFQYSNYTHAYANPVINNSLINLYLDNRYSPKRIWLFDRQDSSYSILENGNYFGNYYANIGMNAKRNMWTNAAKKQMQNFRLVIEINDTSWIVKNIAIDSSVHLFLTLHPSEFRKLGKKEYILYDRLAKNLTRAAMIKWIDTPSVNTGLFVIPFKDLNGKTGVEGTVIGPGIKYPVENAFVVLEKNGIFVRGAITNREGRFNMEELQPGLYMLKIRGANYHYWLHYALQINAGFNHLVQAEMKPYSWFRHNEPTYATDADGENRFAMSNKSYDSYASGNSTSPSYAPQSEGAYSRTLSEGLISTKKMQNISVRGSRADGNATYIDGVRAVGMESFKREESDFEEKYLDTVYTLGWSGKDRAKEDGRLNQMAGDVNAKRTRKDFKDYAYWIPNLYTNKQGKTAFSVKYPDNVTSWKTFVPAMDGKRHSGLGELTVRSYKPVVTSLALPLFLTEGDSLIAYGRVMNYTGSNLKGKYAIKYNQNILGKEINFKDFYTDSMLVTGSKPGDTLSVEASFELLNGYRDAEMRQIIVNAASVIAGKSMFAEINTDTSLVFKCDSNDIGMEVAVYNHKLALILNLIAQVENLNIYDNRSVAAYLNALLIKKSICKQLNIPFTQEKLIRETMTKLKKGQDDNGLFGWFKGGKHNFVVSTYVADAMFRAQQMGYDNNTWLNVARKMEKELPHVWGQERLEYLLSLKNMKRTVDYDSFMKALKPNAMDRSEKLEYWRLQQLLGKKFPVSEINDMMELTYEGNLRIPGTWNWRFAPVSDDAANTYKAWQILFDANESVERRNALVNYLATECTSYGNSWIKAAEAMLAESTRDSIAAKELRPEVTANGKLIPIQNLPAIIRLKPGESLTLKHAGGPIYVAANRKFKTYNPITDPSQFNIQVHMPKIQSNQMVAGVPVEMKVTVFAKRNQFNSIIEIPIPAGCVYGSKIQSESWVETHREYQTDRVLIFSDELPFGYHTFTIRLVPRFSGTFYTAPARTALMFYPDKAAYSQKQRWLVSK